ncbi:tRNA 2'-phosphotransferase 1 [Strongylocentrotus purpuratus]|uniref:2'-phosphotransferase n=1 Tax=Strongylocentrotus purpuratus TaxID=7668 RepID=A0A7M7RCA9_STRPU|nr:tRNA 2'-phosphotransferase 1 [Strongylocentrotus purpuratus]|eukprot:XP_786744.1 PREDICTED: tRNA 2'-phosphotransferase 1 [Strongylocentrotus purpuratus]
MDVRLSKLLSLVLRHRAQQLGFNIYPGGYVLVKDLLAHKMFKRFTEADIRRVVASNDKQRFSFKTNEETGELMICANQGHSFDVPEPELEPITDASRFRTVVHGTYFRHWDQIRRQGLKRMNRTHIHFAQGVPGADGVISGMRRSCQVMIFIDLPAALRGGVKFFLSKNGVVLSPGDKDGILRTRYFSSVMEARSRHPIAFEKH